MPGVPAQVSRRQDLHPGGTCYQPVCARRSTDSALKKCKNADTGHSSKPSEPPGTGCTGDFDVQMELRTTAYELFVSPSDLLKNWIPSGQF